MPYDPQKLAKVNEDRGKSGSAGKLLLNRIRNTHDWNYELNGRQVEVIIGELVSGEKLIDDLEFRNSVMTRYPLAKGGEMEGPGIYAACDGRVNEWILVKGICDYADGKKKINKKANQTIAVQSALNFCHHLLSKEHILEDIGIFTHENLKKKSKLISPVNRLDKINIAEFLEKQVKRQLKKQVNSGKYLRDTFMETGDHKDFLRFFSHPLLYIRKCFEEAQLMDFRTLNKQLQKKGTSPFQFDIQSVYDKWVPNISTLPSIIEEGVTYLETSKALLENANNEAELNYRQSNKFAEHTKRFEALKAKVALLTEMAGQGKTNFLCDFSENFLSKAGIPSVFLTGVEVQAENIRTSILSKLFPEVNDLTFEELLSKMTDISEETGKFFIIIIDGINENSNARLFAKHLETFLEEVIEYPYLKVILSCRTEYYKANFSNLEKSSFVDDIFKIQSLLKHNRETTTEKKLLNVYFKHFNIRYKRLSERAKNQLTSNFLLLRIFSEAYAGFEFDFIDNIYKEELFTRYYEVKSEEINKRISDNDEFNITGEFDIRNFLNGLVSLMVERRSYVNIPLISLIENPKQKEMYIRFLDENILVKRDLQQDEKGIFTQEQVVNFTFDEFRDFLISKFLIEKIYIESTSKFKRFLETELAENSPLEEGCRTFLFYAYRKANDKELNMIMEGQAWFEKVFLKCIFKLKDEDINQSDKRRVLKGLDEVSFRSYDLMYNLIIRNDLGYYKNLNIDLLFEWLRKLSENDYKRSFISNWGGKYDYHRINQQELLDVLKLRLSECKDSDVPNHKLFELLLYMFLNDSNWDVQQLYELYYNKYPDLAKPQIRLALTANNKSLTEEINFFVYEYEIEL